MSWELSWWGLDRHDCKLSVCNVIRMISARLECRRILGPGPMAVRTMSMVHAASFAAQKQLTTHQVQILLLPLLVLMLQACFFALWGISSTIPISSLLFLAIRFCSFSFLQMQMLQSSCSQFQHKLKTQAALLPPPLASPSLFATFHLLLGLILS